MESFVFKRIAIDVLIAASGFCLAACSSISSSPAHAQAEQSAIKEVTVALTRSCVAMKGGSTVLQQGIDDVEFVCSSYSDNAELMSAKVVATHHPEVYVMTLRSHKPNVTAGSEAVLFVNYLRSAGWSIKGYLAHFTAKQGDATAEVRLSTVDDGVDLEIHAAPANQS
jgi:hypothetical protein